MAETRGTATGRLVPALALVIGWEAVGRLDLVANGALPGITEIAVALWRDRADYPGHVAATLYGSSLGFLIGNTIAILAGVLFFLSPLAGRLARGLNIAVFAVPPIAIAPILALTLSGQTPRVVLAAMGCYFVTMTATVVGLSQHDTRIADVIRAYGGRRTALLRLAQWREALPMVLGGLRIAAPNAVLGAILAEFGGGGRWGLGSYLLGSLGRAEPARLWGIGLVATAIAGLSYGVFALLSSWLVGSTRTVTLNPGRSTASATDTAHTHRTPGRLVRIGGFVRQVRPLLLALGSIALPLLVWWAFVWALDAPTILARTPLGVVDYLFGSPGSAAARDRLVAALAETLPITFVGMAAGLGFAFLLAIGTHVWPRIVRAFLPVALVTQTMPLVALTPLLVLLLGRGEAVTLWITISVTFFPAFVTLAQGLALVPRTALDVPRAYGAGAITETRLIALPASLPYLFAATRLTVPRALLGVMIAEWLATGRGLGNLLNQSRGYLDYGMIWSVAAVSVLVAVACYHAVLAIERPVLRRLGLPPAD